MAKALYIAYFTGVAGQSIGLFYIGDGLLAGVDVATMQYNGALRTNDDGSLEGEIEYVLPAGVSLITGAPPDTAPTRVSVKLALPTGFDDGRTILIETPLGPVNARTSEIFICAAGVVDAEYQQNAVRQLALELLQGKRPLPVSPFQPNPAAEKFPPPPKSAP